jgi:hypothetical protein
VLAGGKVTAGLAGEAVASGGLVGKGGWLEVVDSAAVAVGKELVDGVLLGTKEVTAGVAVLETLVASPVGVGG